ncbi:MAG: hypothetical protein ACRCW7_06740 [Cetobacterium sp.]
MSVLLSTSKIGIVGIAGHVGCGHTHSLNNQVQDDSVGLAVVLSLFKEATGLSLLVKKISFEGNKITVTLESGGVGYGVARRGITAQEKKMMNSVLGKEAIMTHSLVLEILGRIYGQGVLEVPVALQTALANAALNSFLINYPNNFIGTIENVGTNHGYIVGTVLKIDGVDVSVLGTVNATLGGIGPNEDLEGNSANYSKKEIVEELNMNKIPNLILESMSYSSFSKDLIENTYLVRGDELDDNPYVIKAIVKACKSLNLPLIEHKDGMKRTKDLLRNNTKFIAEKIINLGEKLKKAETSEEKVNIVAELSIVVSQDCGGISFMSNNLHEKIGGAGMMLKTSAVINLICTDEYIKKNPIPFLSEKELEEYVLISKKVVNEIYKNIDLATEFLEK